AEFAPRNRRNLFNAIVYSGVPAGGVMASIFALLFEDYLGWRGLFLIGATPLLFLFPLALFFLPESPRWLAARGRRAEAIALCERKGLPIADFVPVAPAPVSSTTAATAVTPVAVERTGF